MNLPKNVRFEFVEFISSEREEGVFYISIPYRTIVHSCLCGCGSKIVTPIRPDKWVLTYDGDAISLNPSVGNWSYPCQSHYVIRRNRVIDAGPLPEEKIAAGRRRDARLTARYYDVEPEVDRWAASKAIQPEEGTVPAASYEGAAKEAKRRWNPLRWLTGR